MRQDGRLGAGERQAGHLPLQGLLRIRLRELDREERNSADFKPGTQIFPTFLYKRGFII